MAVKKRNNVAIYCRLSVDDGLDQESQSISNQKDILTKYVSEQGWNLLEIYIDDGYSGTNFDRPNFIRMKNDIECGLIDIVITKDLSRLGRDYITTGQLIDNFFPENNVRYIALNDNVDSQEGIDDFIPFKNIVNEWYAKDISKKIRSVQRNQMSAGEFKKSSIPLYGYMYDADSKRIPNPDTAVVVKTIFSMFNEGYSLKGICDYLIENRIKTPMAYYKEKNPDYKAKITGEYDWTNTRITAILKNREYLGHYIRGKTTKRFKSKKVRAVPLDEQYVFENVFEALITQEEFDLAQVMFTNNVNNTGLVNPFIKIARCGICGGNLKLNRHLCGKNMRYEERLCCTNASEYGKASIRLEELKEVVRREIYDLREVILAHEDEFRARFINKIEQGESSSVSKEELQIRKTETRIQVLDKYIQSLFEKNIENPMPGETYKNIMKEYMDEKKMLEDEVNRFKTFKSDVEDKDEVMKTYKAFMNTLKNINDSNILSHAVIKGIISKIRITTFKYENAPHNKLGKKVEIIYKSCDDFIKEFIKEKSVDANNI